MLHGSTERLHHLAKIYEERIAPLLNPVFSRYRIGTGAKCQSGRWKGTGKVSNQGCAWFESPVAYNYFAGGAGGDVTYKPVICPAGYIMTGTRMFGVSKSVDDEHVDAYCCPLS